MDILDDSEPPFYSDTRFSLLKKLMRFSNLRRPIPCMSCPHIKLPLQISVSFRCYLSYILIFWPKKSSKAKLYRSTRKHRQWRRCTSAGSEMAFAALNPCGMLFFQSPGFSAKSSSGWLVTESSKFQHRNDSVPCKFPSFQGNIRSTLLANRQILELKSGNVLSNNTFAFSEVGDL